MLTAALRVRAPQTNQHTAEILTSREHGCKWWHRVLCFLVDATITNAHTIFLASRHAARLRGVAVTGTPRGSAVSP